MTIRLADAGPDEVAQRQDRHVALYPETLAEPPFHQGAEGSQSFARELAGELEATSFASVELWVDGALGGFCYG